MKALRPVILTLVFAGTCAGGAAAGSVMTPNEPEPDTTGPKAVKARPGSESIGARASDPTSALGWAVRRYSSETGLDCAEAGRYDGRSFGRERSNGEVDQQPADEAGTCAVPNGEPVEPVFNRYPKAGGSRGRSVLFGQTRVDVKRLEVQTDGARIDLPRAADGTFLLVLPGLREASELPVTATLVDGSLRRYDWR